MPRYIDADALKDVIQQHDYPLSDKLNSIGNGMFTLGIFQAIDQMPTVSPDEVRGVGKWVDKGVRAWSCSCCGTPLNHIRQFTSFEKNELPNYCPSCGARMKGAEDGATE